MLESLAARQLIDSVTFRRLRPTAFAGGAPGADQNDSSLPIPHPLDYDWRFEEDTAQELLQRCLRATQPGDVVAFLGTPSLFQRAIRSSQDGRTCYLLERSEETVSALRAMEHVQAGHVVQCDLARDDLPVLKAKVVVADPPWYTSDTRLFLWAAARLSRPGAEILLAQPSIGTRPGVLAERESIQRWARDCGLKPHGITTGNLGYTSPPFERSALVAGGLEGVPDGWRRGDLMEFRRTRQDTPSPSRPDITRQESGTWAEVTHHGTRIRFKYDAEDSRTTPTDPRLLSLVEGDVLRTVSLRDPVRAKASVWTSGNRIFSCRSPHLLKVITEAVTRSADVEATVIARFGPDAHRTGLTHIRTAERQVRELLALESRTLMSGGRAG
ncbi:hypothetical protein ACM01_07790 [Streptomyces viridochromogenes]|uniref:Methyltransferase n=1 Tax=Streptomyces viridochromogenes TaxID=1938 RepID=A0A0J8CCT0_STRVR|nr:hypothetical protein ACM01_07790 [Streptomyces viridochromogenes]KOG08190.1 hypothetical protein ADK35_41990 [Streptomyces viridochromogenes]KOG16886.1 hypothetical protein ADK36_25325 [Streptomyces viridochromogenes]